MALRDDMERRRIRGWLTKHLVVTLGLWTEPYELGADIGERGRLCDVLHVDTGSSFH